MKWVLIGLLKAYRLVISPLYGQVCRYHPSCSAYALEAVQEHDSVRGSWLALRRLVRCHPWAAGGYDPVPPRRGSTKPEPISLATTDLATTDRATTDRAPINRAPTTPGPIKAEPAGHLTSMPHQGA